MANNFLRIFNRRKLGKLENLSTAILLIIFASTFCACKSELTSANYWKGAEKETAWVEKHYKTDTSDDFEKQSQDAYIPAFSKKKNTRFKVGVVISGDYWEFFENFKGLVEGLTDIGWANRLSVPETFSHCDELVSWMNNKKYSDYVEFPPEYFINLQWGENTKELEQKFFANKVPAVDVVIVYGGMAAKAFYEQDDYPIPVMADAITDCFEAGVTKTLTDSGKSFFTNKIDPSIYEKQIRLFHQIVGFKKLGIIYGDDEYGYLYGAVKDVEKVAKECFFEIVRNTNVKEYMDDDTPDLYLAALKDLVTKVDAVYLGASTAITEYHIMPKVVQILNDAKIPSFSLEGTVRVKEGVLFSLSTISSMKRSGIWMANKLTQLFAGENPQKQSQIFENSPAIAINLDTAKKIGYSVPLSLMVNSDELYIDSYGTLAGDKLEESLVAKQALLPCKRSDNKKFRIAVVQSGEYWEFTEHFKGIIQGLKTNGWINLTFDASKAKNMSEIYALFEKSEYSNYIDFAKDCFIDLNWTQKSNSVKEMLKNDVDLVIAFGGVAGNVFAKNITSDVPVLLEAITDPIGSGIIHSVYDSGKDNITCRVDQTQFQRQIQLFRDFVPFKKLGIVYGDDEYGRLYSAVNDIELMALKNGFEIIKNTNVKEYTSSDTVSLYLTALKDVCSKADAVFIGASTAVTEYDSVDKIVQILKDAKIPSFALEGDIRVKEGILLGVSSVETEKIGLYNAGKIAAILYGEIPRLLSQEFTGVPMIAINLDMAEDIGFDIPLSTLGTIDQIYGERLQ